MCVRGNGLRWRKLETNLFRALTAPLQMAAHPLDAVGHGELMAVPAAEPHPVASVRLRKVHTHRVRLAPATVHLYSTRALHRADRTIRTADFGSAHTLPPRSATFTAIRSQSWLIASGAPQPTMHSLCSFACCLDMHPTIPPSQLFFTRTFVLTCLTKVAMVLCLNALAAWLRTCPARVSPLQPAAVAEVFASLFLASFFPSLLTALTAESQAECDGTPGVDSRCLQHGVWRWLPVHAPGALSRTLRLAVLSGTVLGAVFWACSAAVAGCWTGGDCELPGRAFVACKAVSAALLAASLTFIALPAALAHGGAAAWRRTVDLNATPEEIVESVVAKASACPALQARLLTL